MSKHSSRGRPWTRIRAEILATSTTCWICGHPGSDSVDHLVPKARGGTNDPANLAPAHHRPCPTCGQRCNSQRGTGTPPRPRRSRPW